MRLSKARKEIVNQVMKDTIFEAAGSVLERHGVCGITMDRVASTAGLAPGSLYNYFRNKEDMLQFIYARLVDPFFQLLEEIATSEQSAPEKLEKIVRMGLDHSNQERGLIRLLVESGQDLNIRSKVRPRALRMFTGIFSQGIGEGSFHPHNPAHAARMFHGCFAGLFDLQAEGSAAEDVQEYVEGLVAVAGSAMAIPAKNHLPADSEAQRG